MNSIQTIRIDDTEYPELLRHISSPPSTLYYRGILTKPQGRMLAVVGTRRMSVLGRRACDAIIPPLSAAGYVIISGLAYGIDTCSHVAALDACGITWVVLANGVDDNSIYPRENLQLVHRIIESGGCVFSEFPPGTTPRKEYFPQRNRIVSGMSHGVLVIEAPIQSGALITAFQALNENREVLAVPGPITHPTFEGTNLLLKKGAHVVTCANDVFDVFGDEPPSKQEVVIHDNLSEEERIIIACIATEPLHLDAIAERANLDIRTVHSTLGNMELKELVISAGNGQYVKK